jgi:hypothetical protein
VKPAQTRNAFADACVQLKKPMVRGTLGQDG